jgi:N6-adenosine-specific RNA methylase IME4
MGACLAARTALAIPDQPGTAISTGFSLAIRNQLARANDIESVDEGRRRLAAWHAYVTNREQRDELNTAIRWCEIRIGELLGPATEGRPAKTLPAGNVFDMPRIDRHKFRQLAENRDVVVPLLESGVVARNRLLAAIKEHAQPEPSVELCNVVDSLSALGDQKFGTIYADPPWQYGNQATRASTDNHYGTMTLADLCDMPVADHAADDAHLHLWTTNGFLPDSFRVIEAWGFEYRSCFVWAKPKMGIGNYWRVSHEFLLLGIRGNAKRFRKRNKMSWAVMNRGKHSAKPESVREMIEDVSPGPYLEMFGRRKAAGWTVMGNEVRGGMQRGLL